MSRRTKRVRVSPHDASAVMSASPRLVSVETPLLSHTDFQNFDAWDDADNPVVKSLHSFVRVVYTFLVAALHPEEAPAVQPRQSFVFAQRATSKSRPLTAISLDGQWVVKGPYPPGSRVPDLVQERCAFFKLRCPKSYVHWVRIVVDDRIWIVSVNLDPHLDIPVKQEIVYAFRGPFGSSKRGPSSEPRMVIDGWRLQRTSVPTRSPACRPLDRLKAEGDLPDDQWLSLLIHHAWRHVIGSGDTGLHNCLGSRGADFEDSAKPDRLDAVTTPLDLLGGCGGAKYTDVVRRAVAKHWPAALHTVTGTIGGDAGLTKAEEMRYNRVKDLSV